MRGSAPSPSSAAGGQLEPELAAVQDTRRPAGAKQGAGPGTATRTTLAQSPSLTPCPPRTRRPACAAGTPEPRNPAALSAVLNGAPAVPARPCSRGRGDPAPKPFTHRTVTSRTVTVLSEVTGKWPAGRKPGRCCALCALARGGTAGRPRADPSVIGLAAQWDTQTCRHASGRHGACRGHHTAPRGRGGCWPGPVRGLP